MTDQPPPRIVPLTRADLPLSAWSVVVPIRFGQCDVAGIVYTPNYFDICNTVVEQFFCDRLAIDYYGLIRDRGLGLGYAHAACDFLKPNVMGDRLEVFVIVERIGGASYSLLFHVLKEGTEVRAGAFRHRRHHDRDAQKHPDSARRPCGVDPLQGPLRELSAGMTPSGTLSSPARWASTERSRRPSRSPTPSDS